ncbi:MAG: DUF308 domain-containing protein [Prevotella sp.]|nr:DUF308 domain-containing protein [Prevotella sp.]
MKAIRSSIFRALCAVAVGALLVKYRQEMVQWMTITIGILFLLSGIVAVNVAYISRQNVRKQLQSAAETASNDPSSATANNAIKMPKGWKWSISAGVGSMILGAVLALMPGTFVNFLIYILSAFLILGAIQQFVSLATASRLGSISILFWIMPSLLFIAGIVALAYPEAIASAPLFFIGWCMIIYGIVECVNSIKTYRCRKAASTTLSVTDKPDFSDAETVDYIEMEKE